MIAAELLSESELRYINDYHSEVLRKVAPHLQQTGDFDTLAWLEDNTQPIKH